MSNFGSMGKMAGYPRIMLERTAVIQPRKISTQGGSGHRTAKSVRWPALDNLDNINGQPATIAVENINF